ncbi:MAG: LysR family transcriptional regulator ArgP [Hydrogenophaga sp.]|nr:LysR family transcriptional regulator ArgP [Hydrogenophaga sp.]
MVDYPSLFALSAVVREGSFEGAARRLHVTPSAVSQRIRLLEERVGGALVVRGQPCLPTEMGRRLCQHADRVRLLEHELRGELPGLAPDEPVHVNVPVAVNADSLATWFLPALTGFAVQSPVLMQVSVDDEGHTAEWLRSGAVLAAVTAVARPASGCSVRPLGALRYVAAASTAFVDRFFPRGVDAGSLSTAPSLMFNTKDSLQQNWVQRQCGQAVELPSHSLPTTQGFVTASLAGMGWAMHPLSLVQELIARGELVELVPGTPLDVPLYWQQARAASNLLEDLTRSVLAAAREGLLQ